ncbi:hypothetical protein [Goodfellowiella coeruleoviolacea]|uniref:Uncharacterized protein n=1 Tax=Goodfellowiella coeruleoviolacea TaxID=334858 RepID=A0AAE3GGR6_9PSEU|nr:hypothetical protein [Goodfellowiella coeruleoviolacea]MCP2167956.1 hypothetical protein [Goodfellowiella coeruleoviolacea]
MAVQPNEPKKPKKPKKLCPKVILEGTRLTRKTDLAFALNEHPGLVGTRRYRYHSPLISAEWSAFSADPWGRGLINFAAEETELAMETYRTWARLFELQRYYSWIVDRFHLSTEVFQASQGRHHDFGWLEDRLRPLGFAVVLCLRDPDTFAEARRERLRISAKPEQYDDLSLFRVEQERLRAAAARSTLPVLELQVADRSVAELADEVADWLAARGLLGTPDELD